MREEGWEGETERERAWHAKDGIKSVLFSPGCQSVSQPLGSPWSRPTQLKPPRCQSDSLRIIRTLTCTQSGFLKKGERIKRKGKKNNKTEKKNQDEKSRTCLTNAHKGGRRRSAIGKTHRPTVKWSHKLHNGAAQENTCV